MTLTVEQEERLTQMLGAIQESMSRLTDWERNFVNDQIKRFDEFQSRLSLSPKQWAVLNKIYEKVADAGL